MYLKSRLTDVHLTKQYIAKLTLLGDFVEMRSNALKLLCGAGTLQVTVTDGGTVGLINSSAGQRLSQLRCGRELR